VPCCTSLTMLCLAGRERRVDASHIASLAAAHLPALWVVLELGAAAASEALPLTSEPHLAGFPEAVERLGVRCRTPLLLTPCCSTSLC
jgi:hypothetical protein